MNKDLETVIKGLKPRGEVHKMINGYWNDVKKGVDNNKITANYCILKNYILNCEHYNLQYKSKKFDDNWLKINKHYKKY